MRALRKSPRPSLFRSSDSRSCDNICGNLQECYVQKNIEEGMQPEHRMLNKEVVPDDYRVLLHNYWDTKIQNFSVTDQGTHHLKRLSEKFTKRYSIYKFIALKSYH